MCTRFSRSFDKTDRSDIGLYLVGFVLSVDFGSGTTLAFLSSDGKLIVSMRKLKTFISKPIMYGNDNFSSWLLILSRPDDF